MRHEFQITLAADRRPPLHLVENIGHRAANEYVEAIAGLSLAAANAAPERGVSVARALAHDPVEWRFTGPGCLARLRAPAEARSS